MKIIKLLSLLFLGIALMVSSCSEEDLDADALTNLPPGVLSISPANNAKIVVGNFDVKAILADGVNSPLASATITLTDQDGKVLGTKTQSLSGTRDSIILEGSEFDADQLGEGIYQIDLLATDASGNEKTSITTFEISLLPFPANHEKMYIAGAFNGWGADEMELVADHTWEIKEVDLQGGAWKFKNCIDWCDEDWGDAQCNGIMESNKVGNGDTDCGFIGLVNIRFNDQTLTYTVRPSVEFATNLSGLYLLGTFNNFTGADNKFNLVSDNTWILSEVLLKPGDEFKFAEMPNFMGKNYGDIEGDGIADEFSDENIIFPEDSTGAYYKVTFNDKSLAYTYEFVRNDIQSIGIIGDATPDGWDNDTNMKDNGDGTWSIVIGLKDGVVKFRANDLWTTNWGGADFPAGIGTQDGSDIPVSFGLYKVTLNVATGEYNFEASTVGIIGSATPGGWDLDTNLTPDPETPSVVKVNLDLVDGVAKFRLNNLWETNWGGTDFPTGVGTQDGPDIPITAGNYDISLNVVTGEYSFE